jgi:hypothetical protein
MTEMSRNADAQRFIEPLPPKPNLDKQRKLAKTLALDYWRGDTQAVARVQALHPKPPAADMSRSPTRNWSCARLWPQAGRSSSTRSTR